MFLVLHIFHTFLLAIALGCENPITLTPGERFTSQNYPNGYSSNEVGCWFIEAEPFQELLLRCQDFCTEGGFDKLMVYDRPNPLSASNLGTFSGCDVNVEVTGSILYISWSSDPSSSERGFSCTVHSESICDISSIPLTITSGNFPNDYAESESRCWYFTGEPDKVGVLQCQQFCTSNQNDVLSVYTGQSEAGVLPFAVGSLVGEYSGCSGSAVRAVSSTNQMYVTWVTDRFFVESGFSCSFTSATRTATEAPTVAATTHNNEHTEPPAADTTAAPHDQTTIPPTQPTQPIPPTQPMSSTQPIPLTPLPDRPTTNTQNGGSGNNPGDTNTVPSGIGHTDNQQDRSTEMWTGSNPTAAEVESTQPTDEKGNPMSIIIIVICCVLVAFFVSGLIVYVLRRKFIWKTQKENKYIANDQNGNETLETFKAKSLGTMPKIAPTAPPQETMLTEFNDKDGSIANGKPIQAPENSYINDPTVATPHQETSPTKPDSNDEQPAPTQQQETSSTGLNASDHPTSTTPPTVTMFNIKEHEQTQRNSVYSEIKSTDITDPYTTLQQQQNMDKHSYARLGDGLRPDDACYADTTQYDSKVQEQHSYINTSNAKTSLPDVNN